MRTVPVRRLSYRLGHRQNHCLKGTAMFFQEMLKSDEDRQRFEQICAAFSEFFQDCNGCLVAAWRIVHQATTLTTEEYHSTILMLVRHVIESLDGVAVLVSKSASHPCQPLLRSALEAMLG